MYSCLTRTHSPTLSLSNARMCTRSFIGQSNVRKVVDGLSSSPMNLPSLILWGPPGCGKTTLAKLLLSTGGGAGGEGKGGGGACAVTLSAVSVGVAEVKQVACVRAWVAGRGGRRVCVPALFRISESLTSFCCIFYCR